MSISESVALLRQCDGAAEPREDLRSHLRIIEVTLESLLFLLDGRHQSLNLNKAPGLKFGELAPSTHCVNYLLERRMRLKCLPDFRQRHRAAVRRDPHVRQQLKELVDQRGRNQVFGGPQAKVRRRISVCREAALHFVVAPA
jgi:hypothetical protein